MLEIESVIRSDIIDIRLTVVISKIDTVDFLRWLLSVLIESFVLF